LKLYNFIVVCRKCHFPAIIDRRIALFPAVHHQIAGF